MYKLTLFILAAVFAVALAAGQYYVPRAYYTIDAEGHESAHVPLRRLRRSLPPFPYSASANAQANANANANSYDGADASAAANANAGAGGYGRGFDGIRGGWAVPAGGYGSSNPQTLSTGTSRRQYGPIAGGRSVSVSSSANLNSDGKGYYDQYSSVNN